MSDGPEFGLGRAPTIRTADSTPNASVIVSSFLRVHSRGANLLPVSLS